jgi:flagellar motor switch protein FliM
MEGRTSGSRPLLARVDRQGLAMVEDLFRQTILHLRTRLINRTCGDVPIRFAAATVCTLGDVFDRLHGQGSAIAPFYVANKRVRGVIVLEGALTQRLVGLMLGESGEPKSVRSQMRQLTGLDLRFAGRICQDVLESMCDASTMPERPVASLGDVLPTSRSVPTLPRSATIIESALDFGPPESPFGLVSVVLPPQGAGVLWPSRGHSSSSRRSSQPEQGIRRVMPVEVPVVAELANVKMSLKQLRGIQVGDTIDLGAVRRVSLKVSGQTAIVGEAGEKDGVRSVKVTRRVEETLTV